jgi:hypothetical protein
MAINLEKIAQKAPGLVNLAKEAKTSIDKRGLDGTVASVALCLDYSGSMRQRYASGEVQALSERALALGTQLDDDGLIDVFYFASDAGYLGQLGLDDYQGGVDRLVGKRSMGTTNYAGAFQAVAEKFDFTPKKSIFGAAKKVTGTQPVFVIFLTDGSPDSKPAAEKKLIELSGVPIFWKFLSVGKESISFLEKLDDLRGRVVDNANYHAVGDLSSLTDQALFDMLLDEYPDWLKAVRTAGILK